MVGVWPRCDWFTFHFLGEQWAKYIGHERLLKCEEPKAAADLMLGAISLAAGSRNMDGYMKDMVDRGQDSHRQKTVHAALEKYAVAVQANREAAAVSVSNSTDAQDSSQQAMELELLQTKAEIAQLKLEADPENETLKMAAELAAAKLEIAQLRSDSNPDGGSPPEGNSIHSIQPWQHLGRTPSSQDVMEAALASALKSDLERIASSPAPAPAPVSVYRSS